jgi:hypothetical protein
MKKEDIHCGLIWDTELSKFIGIFTIRDFLNLIKVIYEKIDNHLQNGGKWTNMKSLISSLFQRNPIKLEDLDIIMESVENVSKFNSDTKSEKSENNDNMIIEEDFNNSITGNLKNYQDLFKIFENINLNDYFSDINQVN